MENRKNFFSNTLTVAFLATLCCALWGSATPFIKIGSSLILPVKNTASTILFAGIRFSFAGLLTIITYSIARRRFLFPKLENTGRIITVSAFQTIIQYIFFYVGLSNTSGVKGTVLSGSNAFFAVLISALVFKQERLSLKKVTACILGVVGIIVINLDGLEFTMNFTGDGFVLFSAIAYSISSSLIKRFSKYEDPVVISGYQFIFGGLVMVAVGLAMGGDVVFSGVKSYAVIGYLSLLSAVAYPLWGVLLKNNPVSKVSIYSFMIPVFGTLLSMLMLDEATRVSPTSLVITLLLICTGIFLINYKHIKNN